MGTPLGERRDGHPGARRSGRARLEADHGSTRQLLIAVRFDKQDVSRIA